MDRAGRVRRGDDPALPRFSSPLAELPGLRKAYGQGGPRARAAATVTTPALRRSTSKAIRTALDRLQRRGEISKQVADGHRRTLADAVATAARLGGSRGAAIQSVLNNTSHIAQTGNLTASRLPAVFLTLRRNREWWATGRLLSYGERVEFNDSELVWQYYPGEGIQLQVLGTFGKANGLWMSREGDKLGNLLDEMTALASTRGGALAWEYYFYFGGGKPPWASAMAQATGLQVLARASERLRRPAYLEAARQGVKLFELAAPTGVGVKTKAGRRLLLYSFAPGQQVLNAFVQTLVGLNDYWEISGDARARTLFRAGERQARLDLRATDTGAWSLYQVGGAESDLSYQQLVTGFISNLCQRTEIGFWCEADRRFASYLKAPPQLELITRRVRAGSTALVRFRVDKMSKVGVTVQRDGDTSLSTSATVSRGPHGYTWKVPSTPGVYDVVLTGTDLAGNGGRATSTITVLPGARART